ncbi:1-acyl-sn-glycerol-3-phosphate acyltransferase [Dokdonia sp. Asnod3-C12]|uniref:1-acyl-sn-glycerol-3-phosphate acyltransferase n=1 Tax=Dokdonia sp. Asnod3-C12 TaxID=3160575 RepID=UPI00386B0F0E
MNRYDHIRPYNDNEVNQALLHAARHPMFRILLQFTFPDKTQEEIVEVLSTCFSIADFQEKVIYKSVTNLLDKSAEDFTCSGFDTLSRKRSYLYLSNHRDIVLDTSLLNMTLIDHGLITTASAIGDNLVQKDFLMELSKLNRNFLVLRGQSPREMLMSSKLLSQYIKHLLLSNRSVWVAQREGRTKDGLDKTQQGVLKMITIARGKTPLMQYLKELNIVGVAISYEYDPTDILKVPEIVAKQENVPYIKTANEDFNSILKGALGNKRNIHIAAAPIPEEIYDQIAQDYASDNDKLQAFASALDNIIWKHYKLWPSNYIAYDLYHKSNKYSAYYDEKELRHFERRLEVRVDAEKQIEVDSFLLMYANPVVQSEKV